MPNRQGSSSYGTADRRVRRSRETVHTRQHRSRRSASGVQRFHVAFYRRRSILALAHGDPPQRNSHAGHNGRFRITLGFEFRRSGVDNHRSRWTFRFRLVGSTHGRLGNQIPLHDIFPSGRKRPGGTLSSPPQGVSSRHRRRRHTRKLVLAFAECASCHPHDRQGRRKCLPRRTRLWRRFDRSRPGFSASESR